MTILQNRYPKIASHGSDPTLAPEVDAASRIKPFTETTRDRLQKHRDEHTLSLGDLAAQLGVSETAVSKYLNGKPEGNVTRLEERIEDVLKQSTRRHVALVELFETELSRDIHKKIELIRKTNDFGLITGPAGIGKTCALDLYLRDNPTTILITASRWLRTDKELEAALFDSIEHRKWRNGTKYSVFLVERFKGSNRTLLIDNAQRLRKTALAYLFDFHDATGCPIVLLGNPEILDVIAVNDQHHSRIGLPESVAHIPSSSREIATNLLQQLWPDSVGPVPSPGALLNLCVQVLENSGHIRALKKQILLARETASKTSFQNKHPEDLFEAAFRAAHGKLIRNYKLI